MNRTVDAREDSDEQLVRAFQRGDARAFERFVLRYEGLLFRLAGVWLDREDGRFDAVQETFLRSYSSLGRFAFRAAPKTWLARVCRNVCREENRRQRRLLDESALPEEPATEPADDPLPVLAGPLHDALSRLPDRQRDVVVLRLLEEWSVADTARVLGCREGTVKAHLHKALQRLRVLLAERGIHGLE